MPDYIVKTVPAVRLVAIKATLSPDTLGRHIGPMFDQVQRRLEHISGALQTPIATYAQTREGVDVVVGYAFTGPPPPGTEVADLPATDAACGVHRGDLATIQQSWQALHGWVAATGYVFAGPCRELYVRAESSDQPDWVVELQQPIAGHA